jgi:hypothetical protein
MKINGKPSTSEPIPSQHPTPDDDTFNAALRDRPACDQFEAEVTAPFRQSPARGGSGGPTSDRTFEPGEQPVTRGCCGCGAVGDLGPAAVRADASAEGCRGAFLWGQHARVGVPQDQDAVLGVRPTHRGQLLTGPVGAR